RAVVESERASARRAAEADQSAVERAATEDLAEMVRHLNASRWPEARAALERAKGRLGDRDSPELRREIDQGTRDLAVAAQLETIQYDYLGTADGQYSRTPERYQELFREAGFGNLSDPTDALVARIAASNIRNALLDALDHWSRWQDTDSKVRILEVARKVDKDPTGWRKRARDPAVRADRAALSQFIATAPVKDQRVMLLLSLVEEFPYHSPERVQLLKRIQQAHPSDSLCN